MRPPFIALAALLAGCVTISPESERVQLYPLNSTALERCSRMGAVRSGDVSIWAYGEYRESARQAMNNLRAAAYREYGANAVALSLVDRADSAVFAEGYAYKCP